MKYIKRSLAVAALLCLLPLHMHAQNTTVTASALKMKLLPIPTGLATFTPVDASSRAVPFQSSGLNSPQAFACSIANGALSGCSVPDLCIATPANLKYQISISTSGYQYTLFQVANVCGTTWPLDAYVPPATTSSYAPISAGYGTAVPSGACPNAAEYVRNGSGGELYICVAAAWVKVSGSAGSMTWPAAPGVPVCTGTPCNAWTTSKAVPTGAIVGTSDTQTLLNKSIDAAEINSGTLAVARLPVTDLTVNAVLPISVCQATTAGTGLSLTASNSPVTYCDTGTNVNEGTLHFPAGADATGQYHFPLPADTDMSKPWSLVIRWKAVATTGSVTWGVATRCVADAAVVEGAFNAANTLAQTPQATTLQLETSTISSVTQTGCGAGNELYLQLLRRGASDSMSGDAQIVSASFVYSRATTSSGPGSTAGVASVNGLTSAITVAGPHVSTSGNTITVGESAGIYPTMTPPLVSSLSWVNQSTAFVSDQSDRMVFTVPAAFGGGGASLTGLAKPLTLSPPYTLTVALTVSGMNGSTLLGGGCCFPLYAGGLILMDDAGKIVTNYIDNDTYNQGGSSLLPFTRLRSDRWSSYNGLYQALPTDSGFTSVAGLYFLRISDDATTRKFWFSLNGKDYAQYYSEASGTVLTPTKWGVGGVNQNTPGWMNVVISVYDMEQTNSILPAVN